MAERSTSFRRSLLIQQVSRYSVSDVDSGACGIGNREEQTKERCVIWHSDRAWSDYRRKNAFQPFFYVSFNCGDICLALGRNVPKKTLPRVLHFGVKCLFPSVG